MRGLAFGACTLALGGLLGLAPSAHAAEVTKVISSFDPDEPFGVDLQVSYDRVQERGLITRENHQGGSITDVAELRYTEIKDSMPLRLAIGLWHDLELHASTTYYFDDDISWGFPGLDSQGNVITNAGNSTIVNNCISAQGNVIVPPGGDTTTCFNTGAGQQALFGVPGGAFRGGFSDLTFGLSFALLSQKRDDTKPTWVISFDYSYPLADAIDPSLPTDNTNRGPMGDKVHKFTPSMAMSKRVNVIEPYFKISAVLPALAPGYHSDCDPDQLQFESYPENCGLGPWTRQNTGEQPPYTGTALFGAEFWAYDDPEKHQSVTIDLQGEGTYVSQGRYYNELSPMTEKLELTDQYMKVGGSVGLNARAAPYFQLKLRAFYYAETNHLLSDESVGVACPGSGTNQVDLSNSCNGINPNFDFRYDAVGRRFGYSDINIFEVSATGVVTF